MKVEFAQSGSKLWIDLNHDGQVDKDSETISIARKEKASAAALRLIEANPWLFPLHRSYEAVFVEVKRFADYLDHPVKSKLIVELNTEIGILSATPNLSSPNQELLNTLKLMVEILPSIKFEQVDEEAFSDQARYDVDTNRLFFKFDTPPDVFIHELSHALLTHVLTYPWNEPFILNAFPVQEYSFRLDYGNSSLTYDTKAINELKQEDWEREEGEYSCPTEESKAASLANETYAIQNQARYILFMSSKQQQSHLDAEQTILSYMTSINRAWPITVLAEGRSKYEELILSYWGKGGEENNQSLNDWVLEVYQKNKHPAFVASKSCIN